MRAPAGMIMQRTATQSTFDVMAYFAREIGRSGKASYDKGQIVYAQGDPATAVFYIHTGKVQVTVISRFGKEAVVAIRGPDEFCGELALTFKPVRSGTVTALTKCEIIEIDRETMAELLERDPDFTNYFLTHLLARTARIESDLVDQLFNSSEIRLARALLLLANFGNNGSLEPITIKVTQETLASLIGTTRARVCGFMTKFRKLGLIKYNGHIQIRKALLDYVLRDNPHIDF